MSEGFEWVPESYLALVRAEIPHYERLQEELVGAVGAVDPRTVLELGTGTGETARRIVAAYPGARLHAIDSSASMLAAARRALAGREVRLELGRLEDPLPTASFDVVVSALAVHHLGGPGKRSLFQRVAARLAPGGRFVLGDLVVPENPGSVVTAIDGDYDTPSSIAEQLAWLRDAGLTASVHWQLDDLAVLVAERP